MSQHFNKGWKAILLSIVLAAAASASVFADTMYLPDVTAAMSRPSYWSDKDPAPDEILASPAEIEQINQDIIDDKSTMVRDLSKWTKDTYDGIARNRELKNAAEGDADYCYDEGAIYLNGKRVEDFVDGDTEEERIAKAKKIIYGSLIENCVDPNATTEMPTGYAICTTRTTLRNFPTDQALPDDPDDPDFDLLYNTAVSVGEPLVSTGKSADGKYYFVNASYLSGWVPAEDIAFCADRNEWLSFWNYDKEKALVVYADKIYTEDSNFAPETANRMLTMGVSLEIADREAWKNKINNRYAYNNYVVWMPVRNYDGSCTRELALISEHCRVSEGYLPVTTANLARVMFGFLGNAYGWGGMLNSQDCSGYVRDVYRCFGLNMARNTTQQAAQPVRKYDLSTLDDKAKAELIKTLPLGTELLFTGHAMIYLGHEGDKLYVISSVSNLVSDGIKLRVRGAVINTLDITRASGKTWLTSLHTAEIPYYNVQATDISGAKVKDMADVVYNGKEQTPEPEVSYEGQILKKDVHYTLSWTDNINTGKATVTISGKGKFVGTTKANFNIIPAEAAIHLELDKKSYTWIGKAVLPKVTVKLGEEILDPKFYDVSYQDGRTNVGSYKVSVKLKDGYSGSASTSFSIIPKGTSLTKLKRGKASFTARWSKQKTKMSSSRITGYQLQYATNKKFTTGKETVTIKKYSTTSRKISQLKKNKKYYVRIRTYKKIDNKKYYSEWSKIKTIKTK